MSSSDVPVATRLHDSRPWWLWPNLLSLDAVAVAVTWQVFLAWVAGVAVPVAASAVLALVVWAVYLADRGLDAHRGANGSDRHRAAARNPVAWAVVAIVALLIAIALSAIALPVSYLDAGAVVAGATAGYFVVVHVVRANRAPGRGMKEASVGFVFAAGAAVPLVAGAESFGNWLPGVAAFAGLCWLNCALISRWEDGPKSGPPTWHAVVAFSLAIGAALGATLPVAVAVVASTAALVTVHVLRSRVSVRAARVLADAVLLSPLFVAVWL